MNPNLPNPHQKQDNFRMLIALLIAFAVMGAYNYFYEQPQQKLAQQRAEIAKMTAPTAPVITAPKSRSEALAATKRIPIIGSKIMGSLSLTGARIDDITLNDHYTTVDKQEHIALLSPAATSDGYYFESGWTSDDTALTLPHEKTVWSLAQGSASELKTGGAVTLQWDNGQGLLFQRKIELDDNYIFNVTQSITNKTKNEKKLNAWYLLSRHSLPHDFSGMFVLHEGPVAFLSGKEKNLNYQDLAEGENLEMDNASGWLGFTDKYWFVGILPSSQETFNARYIGQKVEDKQYYQADIVAPVQTVAPGQTIEDKKLVFSGVKNQQLMTAYEEKHGLENLDLTFDFGIWYLITKPFFYLLHFLISTLGNVGLAILTMTVIIRAVMFPLASKAYNSMAAMKKVGPQLKALQEKHGKDREKLQMEIFELYKKENVNPFSGCWPLFVQIPVFFALYKCILLSVELRHAPFWGWISDLSAADPTNLFNFFGLIPWTPPSLLTIGAWPLLFCLTMIIQKRLTPPMADKMQEQLQGYFPYIITFMLAKFSAGLVIYWTWSNTLGVIQQYYILRKAGEQDVSLVLGHKERRQKKKKDA